MSNRTQYENDLAALKTALAEMGQSAADAVEAAMEALCTADAEAAAAVVQGDGRINNMERDIEHRCMTLLLRQQPVAGDLRRISTAMKVVTDVERIGDHASDIAEIIPHLVIVRKQGDPAVSQAIKMGQKAHKMILDALNALTSEDEQAALRVIAADDEVDYDFNAIKHALAQEIAADPGKVDAALDLLMVIKYLERIGDHAVNLAEWVEFVRSCSMAVRPLPFSSSCRRQSSSLWALPRLPCSPCSLWRRTCLSSSPSCCPSPWALNCPWSSWSCPAWAW